ncbi:TPA: hypothetical protein DCW56_01165 [Candidatus Peregrinibacteria bacterium]|nr:hypothetical protein [Candidatus Peregrinibacteria bacterium]
MKTQKKLVFTTVLTMSLFILTTILAAFATPQSWQEKFQKYLYYEHPASEDIAIVYIDDFSLSDEGLGRWQNWSREYYAIAIDNLSAAGAKVVGIDLIFDKKSQGISEGSLIETLTENTTGQELADNLVFYLGTDHPDDIALANAIESADNVILMKSPSLNSINLISDVATDEGYSYSAISQSSLVLKFNSEDSFSQKISEYFTNKTIEIPDELYINFTGSAGTYDYYSFIDIYNNNFNSESIENKIVLIGPGSAILQDHYLVPLGDFSMYGVEIQANAIQTILDQSFLKNTTATQNAVIFFALALIATATFMYLDIWIALAVLVLLAIAYWLGAEVAFRKGLILNLTYPYPLLALSYLGSILYRYFTEIQDKKALKSAFSHYVSKEVVNEIALNPESLKLGGEQKNITAFFADITNFTTWSEGAKPEELVAQLNEYFSALSEIIMENQGTVDKFEGDAIMAFWGAPLAIPNHAELACKTALGCRYRLEKLNDKWDNEEGKRKINIRIGINSGPAIIGNIGSCNRFDYTAIGDNVNLAARLEGINKFYSTQIIISGNTRAEIGNSFELRRVDLIRVKGKSEPMEIFELLAEKGKLPPATLTLLAEFNKAVDLYRAGSFAESKSLLEKLLKEVGHDGPTETYITRINDLLKNPPKEWTGVWTFTEK